MDASYPEDGVCRLCKPLHLKLASHAVLQPQHPHSLYTEPGCRCGGRLRTSYVSRPHPTCHMADALNSPCI
eukprot:358848-Chlamydomonas_euryale.AAC.10